MAKNCLMKQVDEGNTATVEHEEGWDFKALVAQTEEVMACSVTTEHHKNKLDD